MEIIRLNNVCFRYGDIHVLQNINFSLEKNGLVGVIGPNGGGKTTFLKLILGLLEPSKGSVKVFGEPPKKTRKMVGYVPQYAKFDREFPISVFEVVMLGSLGSKKLFGNYSGEAKNTALALLKKVGMLEYKDRQIGALSGGQIQRILIARALMANPKLLVLDEPMSSVDPEFQKSFYELLAELKKEMAILLITHDISIVSQYVDSLVCLSKDLYHHGSVSEGLGKLEKMYGCPIEMIVHGENPHIVLKRHKHD